MYKPVKIKKFMHMQYWNPMKLIKKQIFQLFIEIIMLHSKVEDPKVK